jgi:hypothetical protein
MAKEGVREGDDQDAGKSLVGRSRGPFLGARKSNCTASRRLHLASSGGAVGRGSQRAAVRPAGQARVQLSVGVERTARVGKCSAASLLVVTEVGTVAKKDLEDVEFIALEVIRFSSMTFQQIVENIDAHPEDNLHAIDLPTGGHRPISAAASRRFWQLAERRLEYEPDALAIDVGTLQQEIRTSFVRSFIVDGKPIEQKFVDRMLNKAVRMARSKHEPLTHYMPCVIMSDPHPDHFQIGPVRFLSRESFYDEFRAKIEADYRLRDEERKQELERQIQAGKHKPVERSADEEATIYRQTLEWIFGYYDAFVWIAEVPIPSCEAKVSRQRARQAVQAALDVLKLFFGHHGGADFRLGDDRGKPHKTAHLKRGRDGVFEWKIASAGEGAFVEKGWYDKMCADTGWALQAAGSAIEAYVNPGIESDHRDRWLGALTWYGQATRDPLPAGQLVKYVAALERLTITPHTPTEGVTDAVTRRTALLAIEKLTVESVQQERDVARQIYRWRSDLMHGRTSPVTKELASVMHLAYRTAQQALFVSLDLLIRLEMSGRRSSHDLEQLYIDLEREFLDDPIDSPSPACNFRHLSARLFASARRARHYKDRALLLRAASITRSLMAFRK